MKKLFTFLLLSCFAVGLMAQAGDDRLKEIADASKEASEGQWVSGGGLGFDLSGLGIVNPRIGAGINRFGIGGLGTYFADRKKEKSYWENNLSLQLGVLRQGYKEDPFLKSTDLLRLQSKTGFRVAKNNKWYATGLIIGQTSLLKTYEGNFLSDGGGTRGLFSQLFSPAQLQFHPGIEWKPDDHFSVLFSPIGMNLIYVGNDDIAGLNVHGNEFGKNNRLQLVPAIQIGYKNKFMNDRVSYTSALNWTTNYLDNPFVHSALNFWQNNFSIALFKGLSLDLFGEAQYDHNKLVQKDADGDGRYNIGTLREITEDGQIPATYMIDAAGNEVPSGDRLGRGVQWTGSFMLRYNHIF